MAKQSEDGEAVRSKNKVRKVLAYRSAVKLIAKALLELADTGNISDDVRELLREATHGR